MSEMTNYLENALLNHIIGVAAYTAPSTLYLALFTVAPTDSSGGTEVSTGDYSRQAITFDPASGGEVDSDVAVEFTAVGAGFGTVVAAAIMDHPSAGNMLFYTPITNRTVNDGDTLRFAVGGVSITLD